jgi:hypothetical protein
MFSITAATTDGEVKEDIVYGLHAPQTGLLWGQLKAIACAAPVENDEALHHRTVDAC